MAPGHDREQKKHLENSLSACNYGGGAGNRTPGHYGYEPYALTV